MALYAGFVAQPEEAVIAPVGARVILNCSAREGYEIRDWAILLPNLETTLSTGNPLNIIPLRNQGFEVLNESSSRNSFLAINGTEENSRTAIFCIIAEAGSVRVCQSNISLLTFYGK